MYTMYLGLYLFFSFTRNILSTYDALKSMLGKPQKQLKAAPLLSRSLQSSHERPCAGPHHDQIPLPYPHLHITEFPTLAAVGSTRSILPAPPLTLTANAWMTLYDNSVYNSGTDHCNLVSQIGWSHHFQIFFLYT